IPAFESAFLGCQVLWVFDNAKIHRKYASDGLLVGNMNLSPGGKNTDPMRDGYYTHPDHPDTIYQQ
ncbi:hypothetical protein L873DRAFT_1704112, partial [Choiromyces venosus 120613-1]